MPVVAVVNRKGGSGKTTTALILGVTLARQGARVGLIDCDPNQPLVNWYGDGEGRDVLVIGDMVDSKIAPTIDRQVPLHDALIVDVEGVEGVMANRAIGRADLILIPMAPTALDARETRRTIDMIRAEEENSRREIPYRVVLVRTGVAMATRDQTAIVREMKRAGIPCLSTAINQRVAFPAMFARKQTLAGLDRTEVNGVPAAMANAEKFTDEVRGILTGIVQARAAA